LNSIKDLDNQNSIENPSSFLPVPEEDPEILFYKNRDRLEKMFEYRQLLMMHSCAIKEIKTKFDVLDTEFKTRYFRNPIHSISTRLKSTSSILTKMNKLQLAPTVENIENNLHDISGVRVICSYIDDIYSIAESLLCQDDIRLVAKKDYIQNPKPSGYRSLHLIVQVPVFFANNCKKWMTVEVQIRTIAMDYWAALEHQLKYKHDLSEEAQEIARQLQQTAQTIAQTDEQMLSIRKQIEKAQGEPTADDFLKDQIRKVDFK
jgi:putative GTP pyrophosphokinase